MVGDPGGIAFRPGLVLSVECWGGDSAVVSECAVDVFCCWNVLSLGREEGGTFWCELVIVMRMVVVAVVVVVEREREWWWFVAG